MNNTLSLLLKISAVLWVIWGLAHMYAGALAMSYLAFYDTAGAISGLADALDPNEVKANYPVVVGAIIAQHGFNLFWIGLVTLICAPFIWKKNKHAIFLAAICGGLADLGYFLFMDLGGYVNFVPGTVMTLVSSAAILLSVYAYLKSERMALFANQES